MQRALSAGVPLVVAGNTEDKPEVAARVAWSGAGVNLRTGTPTPGVVRTAVREVLNDARYLQRARPIRSRVRPPRRRRRDRGDRRRSRFREQATLDDASIEHLAGLRRGEGYG